jgi:hypothetical protein
VVKGTVPSLCTFLCIFVADGTTPRPRGYTLPSPPVVDLTREAFPYRFSTSSEEMPEGAEMVQEQQAIEEVGFRREGPAYRSGWEDGRFGPTKAFLENPNLARWAEPQERLAYYRGHRDGRWDRDMLAHGDPA